MPNIPQTINIEVCNAINALILGSDRFRDRNDDNVKAIVREIEKLKKVDPRQAFVSLGSLSAICGDVDGVVAYHRKALLLPDQAETRFEYCVSLMNAGLYSFAQEIASGL
jgi:hypothetical protein